MLCAWTRSSHPHTVRMPSSHSPLSGAGSSNHSRSEVVLPIHLGATHTSAAAALADAEPIDLVIANAGVSEETTGTCDDVVAATRAIFPVNVVCLLTRHPSRETSPARNVLYAR